jgi:hypothetical protein
MPRRRRVRIREYKALYKHPLKRESSMPNLLAMMLLIVLLPATVHAYTLVDYTITGANPNMTAETIAGLGLPGYTGFTFSASLVTVQVDACQPGYYSYDDAQTCTACAAGKYSPTITAVSIDTCIPCESGKYSGTVGANSSTTCLSCPNSTYFSGSAGTSLSVCVACPANSSSYSGSKLIQACVCLPGFVGPNGGPCSICNPPDWFISVPSDSGMNFGGGGTSLYGTSFWCLYGQANPCPLHSTAGLGAYSLADCLCDAKYYGDTSMGSADLTLCQVQPNSCTLS